MKKQAFPRAVGADNGMELRDWFATFAPEPTEDQVKYQLQSDHTRNPHGDSYKPKRRSTLEIIADLKYAYADAMVAASAKEPVKP